MITRMHGTGLAALHLADNLEKFVRPSFLDEIKTDWIFKPVKSYILSVSEDADTDEIVECLVERFIDEGMSKKLAGRLMEIFVDKEPSYADRDIVKIFYWGHLTDELEQKIESIRGEYEKIICTYLSKVFMNYVRQYFAARKKRLQVHEEVQRDIGYTTEPDAEELSGNETSWEDVLIMDTQNFLGNRVHIEKRRALYNAILMERITAEKKMTLHQLGESFGVSKDTIGRAEKTLKGLLREFYQSQPDIQNFIGPGIFKKEEVDAPDYRRFLKEEVDQKNLYEWLKGNFRSDKEPPGETTLFVLKRLSEGKTVKELSTELEKDPQYVQLIKTRYFNREYESWYRDRAVQETTLKKSSS
jgi:hypothetical protein